MELIILIDIWIIAIVVVCAFFQGAFKENKVEEDKIEIKYIDLEENNTLLREVHKCEKEFNNFLKAILKYDREKSIEGYYDSMMAMNNILNRLEIPKSTISERQGDYYKRLRKQGLKLK